MSDSPLSQGRNTSLAQTYVDVEIAQISATQPYVDVDALNEDGWTALHIAARSGHVEAVRALLTIRCDMNVRDFNNDTALHIAALMGHTEVVKVLVEEGGADIMARGHKGNTALHYASKEGRVEITEFLMPINPSLVDAVNGDGLTPIELATDLGYDDVVRVLAVEWSEACARALHIAAFEGSEAIIRSLMRAEGSDVNARDEQGDTALHIAADQGHIEAIRTLIELGADVAVVNAVDETPLHVALGGVRFGAFSALLHHIAMYGVVDSGQQQDWSIVRSAWAALGNTADANGATYLQWVVMNRDVTGLRALIAAGVGLDIDAQVGDYSLLHIAAEHGADDPELVRVLLEMGADCNAVRGPSDETALHTAVRHGKSSVVRALVDGGCVVSAVDIDGNTALHLAVGSSDHAETVTSVLFSNMVPTEVSHRNNEDLTALCIAARGGKSKIVQSLLAAIDITDASTMSQMLDAIHCAALRGHLDICNFICDSQAVAHNIDLLLRPFLSAITSSSSPNELRTAPSEAKFTPLHLAAAYARTETVRALIINCRVLVNVPDRKLSTPLHHAALFGHTETVSVLIREHADVNAVDDNERTPLHWAASKDRTEMVSVLIQEYGANVNAADRIGRTPLHLAASSGHTETISVLIRDHGADVNAVDNNGMTPLRLAASRGHSETASVLIREHGANVNAVDNNGLTPLHLAASSGHTETISVLIRDHGADVNAVDNNGDTPLHSAVFSGHTETVSVLIREHRANVNAVDNDGKMTPLHIAASNVRIETASVLIREHGANVNAVDSVSRTPLHYAALRGFTKMVSVLIREHADVHAVDNDGRTPLHIAASMGHAHMVSVLIREHRADVNAVDNNGMTALHLAASRGHSETVSVLIREQGESAPTDPSH